MIAKKRSWFLIMVFIFVFLFYLPEAEAGLRVREGLTREFTVSSDETVESEIIIENTGDEPREVKVYLRDYFYNRDGITKYRQPGTTERSNAGWLQLNPEEKVTVPPQSETAVNYTIDIPDDETLYGTYWSMLMVEPEEEIELFADPEEGLQVRTGVRQISRYGIQIRTNIEDTGSQELSVLDRRVIEDPEEDKTYLELDLENTGERWFKVDIRAEFYDQEGYFKKELEGPAARLYPGTSVRRRIEITDIEPGAYQVLVIFSGAEDQVWGARYNLNLD